jgi:hypothetical protein
MTEEIASLYYLGYYARAAQEGAAAQKEDEEVESIVLRSRLAQNQIDLVINTTNSLGTAVHKGVNLLARSMKAGSKAEINQLLSQKDESLLRLSAVYAICVATIALRIQRFPDVLEVLNGVSHPEAAALRIQALLGISRVDLAEGELGNVTHDVLSKICRGYISLYKNADAVRHSLNDFEDLRDSYKGYGNSSLLCNAIAVCCYALGDWTTGCQYIQGFLENGINDEVSAVNLAVGLAHTATKVEELKTQIDIVRNYERSGYRAKIDEMLKDFDATAARLQNE